MKLKIYNEESTDYFIVEGSLEECREQAKTGTTKRGWKNPYSIELK